MTTDKQALDALDLRELLLPAYPLVLEIEVEDYVDSSGEPALRVQVILDESADFESLKGDEIGKLWWSIHESLLKHGVTLFPYIFFAKRSELAEATLED